MPVHVQFVLAGNFDPQSSSDLPSFLVYDEGALLGLWAQVHNGLCIEINICATIVAQKFDFYVLIPENRSEKG